MDKIEILFREVPHSKPIRSFIQKNLSKWFFDHSAQEAVARVEFFRDPADAKIGCYIEVRRGEKHWRNFMYGKGIQNTFQQCLKHLTPNTHLERSA